MPFAREGISRQEIKTNLALVTESGAAKSGKTRRPTSARTEGRAREWSPEEGESDHEHAPGAGRDLREGAHLQPEFAGTPGAALGASVEQLGSRRREEAG